MLTTEMVGRRKLPAHCQKAKDHSERTAKGAKGATRGSSTLKPKFRATSAYPVPARQGRVATVLEGLKVRVLSDEANFLAPKTPPPAVKLPSHSL